MTLHADEVPVSVATARGLIARQAPVWSDLPLRPAGEGTDNVMLRLGDHLVVRLPRTPGTAKDVDKERTWLPRLAPHLPLTVPEPVFAGEPDDRYPFAWAIYRWIEGAELTDTTIADWGAVGRDLAAFVEALHATDLQGARREGALSWYRGEPLAGRVAEGLAAVEEVRRLDAEVSLGLDLPAVERLLVELSATPQPDTALGWLHGDLRAANLLARGGRLAAVIDFGALSVGLPAAEHAAAWGLPPVARDAYRDRLGLDNDAWALGRGWSLLPNLTALPYYSQTWPEFARSCRDHIAMLLTAET